MFVSHYHLRCISFPRVRANISSSIGITYVLLFVPVAFRGSESGKEAHRLSPGCSSRATEEEIRSPLITLHWEELQKLLIRNCKLMWKGAACLLCFFPFFSMWMVAVEMRVAHLFRALCLALCDAQGTREHQPPELLPPCKPWLCTRSREGDYRWNSTSYWVWQLSRVAISFCSHCETRSIGRGYCPPLSAWLPKAPNASILMGVILKESGKQLALFIDPEEEGKRAPISNFLMSSSIGKNAMAQGISRFFTV